MTVETIQVRGERVALSDFDIPKEEIMKSQDHVAAPDGDDERVWRPIESAPKDGTRVLLWIVHENAKWAKDAIAEGWAGPCVGRWIDHNGGGWCWHGHMGEQTHWMPLPPAPEPTRSPS